MQASMEPPWLMRHRVSLAKWKPVLDALKDVVLQTSALESVLEGHGTLLCMHLYFNVLVHTDVQHCNCTWESSIHH